MFRRRAAVTGVTFAALMLGALPAATFATSDRTHHSSSRPDAAVRYIGATSIYGRYVVDGRWVGRHVRNQTALNQTITRRFVGAAPRGTRYLFQIKITNHGARGRFSIDPQGSNAWSVRYVANRKDVTAAVTDGTYRTPVLAHGESYVVRVSARLGKPGTSLTKQFVIASTAAPQTVDVVSLNLKYSACGC